MEKRGIGKKRGYGKKKDGKRVRKSLRRCSIGNDRGLMVYQMSEKEGKEREQGVKLELDGKKGAKLVGGNGKKGGLGEGR
jgi:hypothetical protein